MALDRVNKLITKIEKDLCRNYNKDNENEHITFVSIIIRNLPKKVKVPIDQIEKWKTAYLINEFNNINLSDYYILKNHIKTKEEFREHKNNALKVWVKDRKHFCESCNMEMSYMSKYDHVKTKRHIKKLDEINNPVINILLETPTENNE